MPTDSIPLPFVRDDFPPISEVRRELRVHVGTRVGETELREPQHGHLERVSGRSGAGRALRSRGAVCRLRHVSVTPAGGLLSGIHLALTSPTEDPHGT